MIPPNSIFLKPKCIFLAVDKGIAVTNKHIRYISNELVAIERETNLKFSSVDYPKLNIVASNKLGSSDTIGAYVSTNGNIYLLSTGYLNVVATYPFIIYHEGLHSIRWRNDYLGSNTAFEEGLAQFVTKTLLLTEGFIGNNHPDAVPVLNTYYLPQIMGISTQIERIFSTGGNITHSLAESTGEVFFSYLEDNYGAFRKNVYAINGRLAVSELKTLYGNDVFENFAPWLVTNRSRILGIRDTNW